MAYSDAYVKLEQGFLKEAADQGLDTTFLKGLIAEATEIQEKWAAAFDEIEEATGDYTFKTKLAAELAEVALMKAAEGEPWYQNPQLMELLGGQGGQAGSVGAGAARGGIGGGLLGLLLGALFKNPMLGLMLGGLGGAGLGGLFNSGQLAKWFGGQGGAADAAAGGVTPPPAAAGAEQSTYTPGEEEALRSPGPDSEFDEAGAGIPAEELQQQAQEVSGGPESDPSLASTTHNDPEKALRDPGELDQTPTEHFDGEGQIMYDQERQELADYMANHQARQHAMRLQRDLLQQQNDNMPLNRLQTGVENLQQGVKNFGQEVAAQPGIYAEQAKGIYNKTTDAIGDAMLQGAGVAGDAMNRVGGAAQQAGQNMRQGVQNAGQAVQGTLDRALSGPTPPQVNIPPKMQRPVPQMQQPPNPNVPPPMPSGAIQAPMPKVNTQTPNVPFSQHAPQFGVKKTGSVRLALTEILGTTKVANLMGPSYTGGAAPSMGGSGGMLMAGPVRQPTTNEQAPLLPKSAPIVYPNNTAPRQMTNNYAVAPKI